MGVSYGCFSVKMNGGYPHLGMQNIECMDIHGFAELDSLVTIPDRRQRDYLYFPGASPANLDQLLISFSIYKMTKKPGSI